MISAVALLLLPLLSHGPAFGFGHDCDPLPGFSGLASGGRPATWAGQCLIDGNAGQTLQALGHLVAEDWLGFTVPWWNPYAGIGMPLAAEMQPAAFFLPFILLLHFANGLLLLKIAVQITAGACMLFCLRRLRLGRGAAMFGALLYELDGSFAWYGDAPMLPLPFLPLLVGGIEQARAAALQGRPGGTPAIACGLGFSLLAGFPETAFLDGILAAFWAGIRLAASPPAARGRMFGKLVAGGVIGLALAAPALVSFLDYLAAGAVTFRGLVGSAVLGAGQAAVLVLPTVFGPPYSDFAVDWGGVGGYLGPALLLPGLVALTWRGSYAWLRGLAAGWTAFWLAVFLGEPVARHVWQAVPVLNQAVVTRYAMPSIAFLWTILAALGWQRLRTGETRCWLAPLLFGVLAATAVLHAAHAGRLGATPWLPTVSAAWLTFVWTMIVTALFALLTCRQADPARVPRLCAAASVLLADAYVGFIVPQMAGGKPAVLDLSPVAFLRAQPGLARSYALDGLLEPNYGSYFGIPTLQAFSLPAPALWAAYAPQLDPRIMGEMFAPSGLAAQAARLQAARARFEDAGVGYVLVPPKDDTIAPLHDLGFVPVFESGAARIYRLAGAKPYFDVTSGGPCPVAPLDRLTADVRCAAAGVLLRREMFDPGWHATLNGRKIGVFRADGVFQAVMLPAGPGRIEFFYRPPHARLMAGLLAAGVGALALGATGGQFRIRCRHLGAGGRYRT